MSLTARQLSIGHGKTPVASGIDLAVQPGQILCLLGPNGCGKTTLFKTLLGLLPALGGRVELNAQPLAGLDRAAIARSIAYVPQQHAPPFPYTVHEVVLMGRTARLATFAQPGAGDHAAAAEALAEVGMADFAEADYSRLSGGQRQLVLIARALAQQSTYLVLDEPTASLDFGNQARVLATVRELAAHAGADGRGIVFSTHDPVQAFTLDAQVLLMSNGAIAARGRPQDCLTAELLETVYGLPVQVERTVSGAWVCSPRFSTGSMSFRNASLQQLSRLSS